jgi:hypothetical protein
MCSPPELLASVAGDSVPPTKFITLKAAPRGTGNNYRKPVLKFFHFLMNVIFDIESKRLSV